MRRRACAALLLCGPLVAGCGAATRVDFASHSRPASPLELSVAVDADHGITVDPAKIRAGLVSLEVINESPHPAQLSVKSHGRLLARTAILASGATAQLKTTLGPSGDTIGYFSQISIRETRAASMDLNVVGRARTGDDELTQP